MVDLFRRRLAAAFSKLCSHWPPTQSPLCSNGGRLVLLSSLLLAGIVNGGKQLGLFEPVERFLFDSVVRQMPDQSLDPRLVIVAVTEEDIQQYGWPLPDATLADLLSELQAQQPKVVGLDLYRSTLKAPGSDRLVAQLQAKNLIAIMNVGSDPDLGEVPPPATVPLERVGFNDFPTDPDGIIRRNLLFVKTGQRDYYSFALRTTLTYLGQTATPLKVDPAAIYLDQVQMPALGQYDGGYQQVDDRGYQILLHYRSRTAPARQLSISQVLSGRYDRALVQGKIVLVGTTARSLKDQFYTPYSSQQDQEFTMSGVVIHAQMVSQLLDITSREPALYRFLPAWTEPLWIWGGCLAGAAIVWRLKHPVGLLLAGGGVVVGLVGVGWLALTHLVWVPMAEPVIGFLLTSTTAMAYKLLYRSNHDSLTDLMNRDAFMVQVDRHLKQMTGATAATSMIVVFLDIDRFKVINESLGHEAGDRVLITLAQRLKQHLPPGGTVARVGGDEFALLLQGMNRETTGAFLEQLQRELMAPFMVGEQRCSTTVSMGVAVAQPGYDPCAADLLRDAHTAMYRAKALGKTRYEVFAAGMLVEAVNRLKLESDLINALENQEFLLYYQPIVDLQTGRIAGFEALVRWQQQDRGFVLPSAFIPVAEETGLIMPLGQWIFQHACQQLKIWREAFPQHAHLAMSINLSNRQFGQFDLVPQIEAVLQETGVPGEYVRLEITESMVMEDVEAAIDLMLRLKSLDLKLGIDDFGTGYSSLSYLHRFPMDTLKVDKSFVGRMEDSLEDREIVHTIIALGHKLGMEIVAEGIETVGQIDLLREMVCEYGQGYHFSRPLSQEAATTLLKQALPTNLISRQA